MISAVLWLCVCGSCQEGEAHFCISDADAPTPLHISRNRAAKAAQRRNRVRVKKTHIALVGGRFDRAAFHDTPPFGSNMVVGDPALHRRENRIAGHGLVAALIRDER